MMLASTGCSKPGEPAQTDEPLQTAEEEVPFEFNPHVYSCFLDACYSDEYRESFFNLCDALQKGEDSFECSSEEIYKFCMDEVTHNQLYPVACMQITGKSPDGSSPYENGVGRIYYTKSKEDFLERQEKFIKEVEDIMNDYIKSDYSKFEKCLALYDYIASNYEYDYDGTVDYSEDGSGCACLKHKKGICGDFAPWYSYLLLQCGVDAIAVSNDGTADSAGYHSWTFVDIDGKGYHIDPTWCLKSDMSEETFTLEYFMMTDEDREASGYPADLLEVYMLPEFYAKDCKEYNFVADDRTYRLPEFSDCVRYDTNQNIIYYYSFAIDTEEHEFKYE